MSEETGQDISNLLLTSIEEELIQAVKRAEIFEKPNIHEMLAYHMGWGDSDNYSELRGKRIRPLLVLLSCLAAGGNWVCALPAATAVELIHNFSLIHDDIEDRSSLRRGRPTVWKKWGIPQAINTGDAMYALAHLEAVRLAKTASPTIGLKAVEILQATCLHLTQGQYLDLLYEKQDNIAIDDYWTMVKGKTAALIAVCPKLGAMAAFRDDSYSELYYKFGWSLGMAYQVQDDIIGIWGDATLTGKSNQSDLVTGKITLPVLYGLSQRGKFAQRWLRGQIQNDELPEVMHLLDTEGGKEYAIAEGNKLINEALSALEKIKPVGSAGQALIELTQGLVDRQL